MRIKMTHPEAEFPVYVSEGNLATMKNRGWLPEETTAQTEAAPTTEIPEEGIENVES